MTTCTRNSKPIWIKIQLLPSGVSSYTSRTHIQRQVVGVKPRLKREHPPLKRLCRSELSSFVFKLQCIFCGETGRLKPDPRNPSRWRAAYLYKTASCGTRLSFKDLILEVCGRWKDALANQVEEDYKVQSVIYTQQTHVFMTAVGRTSCSSK